MEPGRLQRMMEIISENVPADRPHVMVHYTDRVEDASSFGMATADFNILKLTLHAILRCLRILVAGYGRCFLCLRRILTCQKKKQEMRQMKIAVDAMEVTAPQDIVKGWLSALVNTEWGVILVGPVERIKEELNKYDTSGRDIEIFTLMNTWWKGNNLRMLENQTEGLH